MEVRDQRRGERGRPRRAHGMPADEQMIVAREGAIERRRMHRQREQRGKRSCARDRAAQAPRRRGAERGGPPPAARRRRQAESPISRILSDCSVVIIRLGRPSPDASMRPTPG